MNILILAAGLGTRLRPITDAIPKALVPVAGKPLLQLLIEKIKLQCPNPSIVVNIHHHGEQIIDFLRQNNNFGLPITISDERDMLLDTGGALRKAMPLFANTADSVLIHNVDIISDLNLSDIYRAHQENRGAMATLVVSRRKTSRYLLFGEQMQLVGWQNISTGEIKTPFNKLNMESCQSFAFSGIHVIGSDALKYMKDWPLRFPIIDFYLNTCDKETIKAQCETNLHLLDVGKIDSLSQAEAFVSEYLV